MKRKLAEGGMAEIYLAAALGPEGFEKEVVIKVVRSFLARDDGFMKMFVDEARLASRLNHANVVQIFDFAKHDDTHFIAMEYVRGVSLWDLRRRCRELGVRFPSTLVAEICVHVARGLHYAHSLTDRGRPLDLVHRDVTPHNVLVSFDGAVKLTDFGIAKASGNQTSTAAGMLKGKFAYMSPEQGRGEKIDSRTDVFALGIVCWEMLTGGRLFEGDSDVAVLRAVQQSYISPPARLNPDVPPELDGVVMKALERDLDKRFQSAQELERGLANFVLHQARSVEDTNVGMFVSQMFKDELEEMRAAEFLEREHTHSTAKEAPAGEPIAHSVTAVVERDHSKPRESAPPAHVPAEKPKTALLPGTRPRGPLEDEDDGSQQRTDQMKELVTPAPPAAGVVLKDSFAKEVAEASQQLLDEEARRETTQSGPTQPPEVEPAPIVSPARPPPPSRGPFVWVLLSLVAAGFIASLGYLMVFKPKQEALVVMVPPPPVPAPKPEPAEVAVAAPEPKPVEPKPVEPKPVEPKPAEPSPVVEAPSPAPKATKPEKPRPVVEYGYVEIKANPYAAVTIDNKPSGDADPTLKVKLPVGTHTVVLDHPKRHNERFEVDVVKGKTAPVVFRVELDKSK